MQKVDYNTELLAPVGSIESLYAAVENGANAVYLGGKLFNARHFAQNFDNEELKTVIRYAHLNDVKVYVAINILIDNSEMEKALDYIKFLYEEDVDAIIVQDLGLAKLVREVFPDLDIHGSTQMTINNLEGVKFLEQMGFKRVVLARETPIDEIKRIRKNCSIELEGFIHGALCVSYSGQCLMSSVIGGRSGNRGKCAQPCRMPYSIIDEDDRLVEGFEKLHLLSPKDLNTLDDVETFIDAGINSLKIEGRMKRPEYVATIVSTYKKVIDKQGELTRQDRQEVEQIFNRGFTKGLGLGDFGEDFISMDRPDNRGTYLGKVINANRDKVSILLENDLDIDDGVEFTLVNGKNKGMKSPTSGKKGDTVEIKKIGNIGRNSDVYKTSSIDLLTKAQNSYKENKNIYDIDMEIDIKIGQAPKLKLIYGDFKTIAESEFIVETAKNKGITSERVENQLSKLGDTQFSLEDLVVNLDDNAFLPLSVLNELRRDVTDSLNAYLENKHSRTKIKDEDFKAKKKKLLNIEASNKKREKKLSLKIEYIEQLKQVNLNNLDRIYLPLVENLSEIIENLNKDDIEIFVTTEKILYHDDFKTLDKNLEPIKDMITGVSVQNLGSLYFIKENYNLKIHADIGINTFNSYTVGFLKSIGIESITLSPELNLSQIRAISKLIDEDLEAMVYGYIPVMATKTCPMALVKGCSDDHDCKNCNFANGYRLQDRMDKNFFMSRKEGFTTIYNSVPLMVLDSMDQIYKAGITFGRLDFTVQGENVEGIQDAYYKYINDLWDEGQAREFIDNIKNTTEITKGHFFRGVI